MMKQFLFKAFVVASMLLAGVAQSRATTYTWSRYDLSFEVPDGGFVTYSTATAFEVRWDDMLMNIKLYKKDKSDDKAIKENLTRKALDFSMYDTKHGKMKVKGFKPLYIEGTMPDGSRAVICDLVSNSQDLIVEVSMVYLMGDREIVDDVIKSFVEGKKPGDVKEKKHKQKVQSKEDAEKMERERLKEEDLREKRRNRKIFDA